MISSVDVEARGKDFCVTIDLPAFNKEDVNIVVGKESLLIHAKKNKSRRKKQKNCFRKERMVQTFYRRIDLPEKNQVT